LTRCGHSGEWALQQTLAEALANARQGDGSRDRADNVLRRRLVAASRNATEDLRNRGTIGHDAFRRVEEDLDWLELSAGPVNDQD
jgi:CPA1 family monovalent cation:H+ antiporter